MEHKRIINEVMNLKAKNNPEILEQFKEARISIDIDDFGFYVEFNFDKEPQNKIKDESQIPDVSAFDKNNKPLADFILFINDGVIKTLEASSYNKWPFNDDNIQINIDKVYKE